MADPNLIVLYVEKAATSAAFYSRLLGVEPIAAGVDFHALPLPGGFTLGLWSKHKANPAPAGDGARFEIGFMVENAGRIEALYSEWKALGIPIVQELMTLDFGPTFVALDPDGHRLRVCLFDQ